MIMVSIIMMMVILHSMGSVLLRRIKSHYNIDDGDVDDVGDGLRSSFAAE